MSLIWAINDFYYIAGTLNAENLAGNIFLNFSLLSLTEMPSVFIGQFLIDRCGRRWTHSTFMLLATLPMILCVVLVQSQDMAIIILTLVSKLASNVAWFIMWVQAMEIFPTPLRNTCLTIAATVAAIFTMVGPFVVDLVNF